jgi:hypothetical protein
MLAMMLNDLMEDAKATQGVRVRKGKTTSAKARPPVDPA